MVLDLRHFMTFVVWLLEDCLWGSGRRQQVNLGTSMVMARSVWNFIQAAQKTT